MATIESRLFTLRDGSRIVVRPGTGNDAGPLIALDRRMRGTSPHMIRDYDELESDPAEYAKLIAAHTDHPGKLFLVAEQAAAPSALFGRLSLRCGQWRMLAHRGEFGISVDGPWRGRGVGSALITAVLDWAAAHPTMEKVCLATFANNTGARRLYERLGFVQEAVFAKHMRLGPGQYVDDVHMSIWVKPGLAIPGFKTWQSPEPERGVP